MGAAPPCSNSLLVICMRVNYVLEQVRLWLVRERLTISTCFAGVISTSKGGGRSNAGLMSPRDTWVWAWVTELGYSG